MTKWVTGTVMTFAVIFFVALFWGGKKILDRLPSRQKIASVIQSAQSPHSAQSASVHKKANHLLDSAANETASAPYNATADTSAPKAARDESASDLLAVVEEDPRDIRVCENLGRSRFKGDAPSTGLGFDALFQTKREDSVIEAMRFPVRAIFQAPEVASLLRELEGLEKNGVTEQPADQKNSTLEKIGFYGRVMKAGSQLYLNRRHYESIGDRAVHLRTIAKLAMLSPRLANDAPLLDFCREVESAGTEVSDAALQAERTKLLSLISSHGLKPAQLGFDPAEHVKFSVQANKTGFSFSLSDRTAAE